MKSVFRSGTSSFNSLPYLLSTHTFSCSFTKGPAQKVFQTVRWTHLLKDTAVAAALMPSGKRRMWRLFSDPPHSHSHPPHPHKSKTEHLYKQPARGTWTDDSSKEQSYCMMLNLAHHTPTLGDYANFLLEGNMTVRMMCKTESAICFLSELYLLYK